MLRTAGIRHLQLVSNELTTRIRTCRLADARNRFNLLAQDTGALMQNSREHVEAIACLQAKRVQRLMADEVPRAKGTPRGAVGTDAVQTYDMADILADLTDSLINRQDLFFENGPHISCPQGSGPDSALSSHARNWYRKVLASNRTFWSAPRLNPVTLKVEITAAKRFCLKSGTPAGIYTATVGLLRLLRRFKFMHHVIPFSSVFIVYPVPTSLKGVEIIAGGIADAGGHIKCSASRFAQKLLTGNNPLANAMIINLQRSESGSVRMPYLGKECLWTYGPLMKPLSLVMITPLKQIFKPAARSAHFVQNLIRKQIRYSYYILLGIIVAALVIAVIFSRTVTRPLNALVRSAQRLGEGDFSAKVDVRSQDEFGALAAVFNTIGPRLQRISTMEHSLAVAAEVQKSLLPQVDPSVDGLDVSGTSIYCEEIGGDYFDYISFGGGGQRQFGVVIGDVSDHGIASALLMASVRALLHERSAFPGCARCDLSDINRQLCRDVGNTGRFMTLFYAEIDVYEGRICWTRAGHDPALLYDPEKERFEELGGEGVAMGINEEATWQEYQRSIKLGQVIVMATDGVWETTSPTGEFFGKERLRAIIRSNAHQSAREIRDAVISSVTAFRGPLKPEDDRTLVIIKIGHLPVETEQ